VDYFRDPSGIVIKDNAPFLCLPIKGDYVARAHVRPVFKSPYDSGCLMVSGDAEHWAKLCYERTDLGTAAAVSALDLWLQICRLGSCFAMHYSLDGAWWRMVRYFRLDLPREISVGVVAQCPIVPGTSVDFLYSGIEQRSVKFLRFGE
jgi:hypothetical protein